MPDFVSRKKLKKKVLEKWENEGGQLSVSRDRSASAKVVPKRQRKKDRVAQSMGVRLN